MSSIIMCPQKEEEPQKNTNLQRTCILKWPKEFAVVVRTETNMYHDFHRK